uniref:Uncharacterized protein n=1 Tax=Cucumis sativus TaxID=3659 RepID=A0A0A0L3E2_CUCSA
MSTPSSRLALIPSKFTFPGILNCLQNFPFTLSALCHFSPSSVAIATSVSAFRSPLILNTLFSSTSTFTSSFFIPGMSIKILCSNGVSFQSTCANAIVSIPLGTVRGICSRILNGSSDGTTVPHGAPVYGMKLSVRCAAKNATVRRQRMAGIRLPI